MIKSGWHFGYLLRCRVLSEVLCLAGLQLNINRIYFWLSFLKILM